MEIVYKTIENDLEYLKQVSEEVDLSNDEYMRDLKILSDYGSSDDRLLALASIQIGIPKRMIYVRKTDLSKLEDKEIDEHKVMINPVIVKACGLTRYWETCASCLDNMGLIERPYKIEIEYFNESRKKCCEVFEGFPATVIAHEMDHLDGILHIDKAIELLVMEEDDRKEFTKTHPYEIINKDQEFNMNK